MSLIEDIKILCKENETSISKLEEELGFSRGSIYKWGVSCPTIDRVKKVAVYFGVTIDSLVRGNDNPLLETSLSFDKDSLVRCIRESGLSVGQVISVLDQAKSDVLNETAVGN